MLINYIYLKNIRSYKESKIFFPRNSVVLSGDIGSGKSTILIALEFALFGFQSKKLTGESLLRKGESEGEIELSLIIDGKDYIIRRKIKQTKTGISQFYGSINDNGLVEELTITEMKSKIFNKLGYPKDQLSKSKNYIYRYTVYTPQEELKYILYEDEENRIESIRNIFQMDKYKNVKNNISIINKKLKEKIQELKGRLYNYEDKKLKADSLLIDFENAKRLFYIETQKNEKIKENLSNILKELEKLKNIESELKLFNFKIDQSYEDKDNFLKTINQSYSKISEIENKIKQDEQNYLSMTISNNIEQNEEELSDDIFKIQERIFEIQKIRELDYNKRQTLVELNRNINEIEENISSIKLKVNTNRSNILKFENLLKEKEFTELKLEKEKKLFEQINTSYVKNNTELEQLHNLTSKVMQLNNCPTCLQEVSLDHKKAISAKNNNQIIEFKNTLINLENKKLDLQRNVKHLTIEINNFEQIKNENISDLKENEMLNTQLMTLNAQHHELNEKVSIIKLELAKNTTDQNLDLTKLQQFIEDKKILLETIKKNNENKTKKLHLKELIELDKDKLSQTRNELSEMESKLNNLKQEMLGFETKRNKLLDEKREYDEILKIKAEFEIEFSKSNAALIATKKDIDNTNQNMEQLNIEINELEKNKAQLDKYQSLIKFLSVEFIGITDTIEKYLFNTIQVFFDEYFSHWFDLLIEDSNLSAKIDQNFTPIIIQNGHELDFSNLSGGEKTAIALAYRLSLNKVINNLISTIKTKNIIILDEPTEGFSSTQMDKIRDVLDELELDQIIIVSHETKIESFVDTVIRVEKNNHISNVIQEQ